MFVTVTPDWLVIAAAAVLSLLFRYVPGLNTWYYALAAEMKQLIMASLILLTLIIVFTLQCYGFMQTTLVCTQQGAFDALLTYILAIGINQGTYQIIKRQNIPSG